MFRLSTDINCFNLAYYSDVNCFKKFYKNGAARKLKVWYFRQRKIVM